MKNMKFMLLVCSMFFISIFVLPFNVNAEETAYITYTDVKVNGESRDYSVTRYNSDKEDNHLQYGMSGVDNHIYSFVITGYNLNDTEEYTYTLISDFKNYEKKYTGAELENGVIISSDDGNARMISKLVDSSNNIIKNMRDDVYYKKTTFKFNNNFDTTEMDAYVEQTFLDSKVKLSMIVPKGDIDFSVAALNLLLREYETDKFWFNGICDEEGKNCTVTAVKKTDGSDSSEYYSKDYSVEFDFETTNSKIKKKADNYASKFSFGWREIYDKLYILEDLENINYIYASSVYNFNTGLLASVINYCSGFQKALENSNYTAVLDPQVGWDGEFTSGGYGNLLLSYDGIIYSYSSYTGVKQNNVIYIPNNTEDTREAYIEEALNRIKKYIPKVEIKIEYAGQIADLDMTGEGISLGEIVDIDKTLGEYYKVIINGDEHFFFIAKDSSKMQKPKMNTKDVNTDISISTESSDVPLDTKIKALIIDFNSKEYKEFLKKLKKEKGLVVDLKLFSETVKKNISKLNDDKFKVYIPLTEELKGLDLMAYYVKDNGEIENYSVIIDGDYLVFETDHFSTYVIGENTKVINPNTSDGIISYIIITIISILGIVSLIYFQRRYNS